MTQTKALAETLIVNQSPIKSGGRARLNNKMLNKLDINGGDHIVVSSEKKDVLVKVYGDDLVEESKIRLRSHDVNKLGVEDKDEVKVMKHKSLLKKLL